MLASLSGDSFPGVVTPLGGGGSEAALTLRGVGFGVNPLKCCGKLPSDSPFLEQCPPIGEDPGSFPVGYAGHFKRKSWNVDPDRLGGTEDPDRILVMTVSGRWVAIKLKHSFSGPTKTYRELGDGPGRS